MIVRLGFALSALVLAGPATAQIALGTESFFSTDADNTRVSKLGVTGDVRSDDIEHYLGIKVERARFEPSGGRVTTDDRAYLRFASTGERWKWNGSLGSDGRTWLGSATIFNEAPFRQEYFLEREIVESAQGVTRGFYYTFIGAAYDLPVDDRNIFTLTAGVQDFTGRNVRYHLRGRYIHVLDPDWGLSAQLRVRYAHSTEPREFDYYSPRWYVEAIPTLQLRRVHRRWTYQAAIGWGRQRDDGGEAQQARLAEAIVTSPRVGRDWYLRAAFNYTDTPTLSGGSYNYRQLSLQALKRF